MLKPTLQGSWRKGNATPVLIPDCRPTMVGRIRRTFDRSRWTTGRGWAAAVVVVLALAGSAPVSSASMPVESRLAAATEAFAAAHPTYPGVALAVVSPRIDWTGSAGHPAFGAHAVLDPRAGFRIASVTKTFTAASILRLVEEGRLGLDDPIAAHLTPATSRCCVAAATPRRPSTSATC